MKSIDIQGKEYITGTVLTDQLTTKRDNLIIWNKLGSTEEVENSEVGLDGVESTSPAPTYAACKFDNGAFFNDAGSNDYIDFLSLPSDLDDRGTIEFWFKPTYDYDDNVEHVLVDGGTGSTRFMIWKTASNNYAFFLGAGFILGATPTFSAGDIVHLAVCWDRTGIDGGVDTARIYENGILLNNNSNTIPSFTPDKLRLGCNYVTNFSANAVIDNIKVWDYAKTEFSDRFKEDGGMGTEPSILGIAGHAKKILGINEGETAKEWHDVWRDLYLMDMGFFSKGGGVNKEYTYVAAGEYQGFIDTITYKKGVATLAALTYTYETIEVYVEEGSEATVGEEYDGLLLWNKLGSLSEVQNSIVGPDLVPVNTPVFVEGKFGSGYEIGPKVTPIENRNAIDVPAGVFTTDYFTIEFWLKKIVASIPDDTYNYELWHGNLGANDIGFSMYNVASGGRYGPYCHMWDSTYSEYAIWKYNYGTNAALNAAFPQNVWKHVAWVFDKDKAAGADRMKIYVDGVLLPMSVHTGDGIFSTGGSNPGGTLALTGHTNPNPATWVMDNLKIYDYAKTDFSDRHAENGFDVLPVLYNKLGSADEIANSEIGVDGVQNGGSFSPCRYGDGFDVDASAEYVDFFDIPNPVSLELKGSAEIWWRPHFDSTYGSSATIFNAPSSPNQLYFISLGWYSQKISFWCPAVGQWNAEATPPAFSAGDIIHIGCVWNVDGIDGSADLERLYWNGTLIATQQTQGNRNTGRYGVLRVGLYHSGGNYMNSIASHLKIWDYCKTSFANEVSKPVLWNKLGSLEEIYASEIGLNGVITGGSTVDYAPVMWDDGVQVLEGGKGAEFEQEVSMAKGCFEFWVKMENAPTHADHVILCGPLNAEYPEVRVQYNATSDVLSFIMYFNATKRVQVYATAATIGYTAAGDIFHIAITWDYNRGTGVITNAKTPLRIYIDGNRLYDSQLTSDLNASPTYEDFQGALMDGIFVGAALSNPGNDTAAWIDNFKYWNYAKTDFGDRFAENGVDFHPMLWNKLSSADDIEHSEVGPDGVVEGTVTYEAARFNDGIELDANGDYVTFDNVINRRQGCIECWFKPNWDSSDTTVHPIFDCADGTDRFYLYWSSSSLWKGGESGIVTLTAAATTHSAGDLIHLALVWDKHGLEGTSDTMRLYVNNVDVGSSTTSIDNTTASPNLALGGWEDDTPIHNADGIIDNVKVWNYPKTDFADRYAEDGLICTPHIWNRLDEQGSAEIGEVGPAPLNITAASFDVAQFDNGFRGGSGKGIQYDPADIPSYDNPCCIEFWLKTPASFINNSGLIWSHQGGGDGNNGINMYFTSSGHIRIICIYKASNDILSDRQITYTAMTTNTWYHVAIVWDFIRGITNLPTGESLGPETYHFMCFVNGAIEYKSERSAAPATTGKVFASYTHGTYGAARNFAFMNYGYETRDVATGGWDPTNYCAGIMDNLKIWNFAKIDFADRFLVDHSNLLPVLWNKVGSDLEVYNSEIGSDGIRRNATYDNHIYGLGAKTDGSLENIDFFNVIPHNLKAQERGAAELWVKMLANHTWPNSTVIINGDTGYYLSIGFGGGGDQFWQAWGPGAKMHGAYAPNTLEFEAYEYIHIACCWDRNYIQDSLYKMRLFINGKVVANAIHNTTYTPSNYPKEIRLGLYYNDLYPGNHVSSNLKIWDYPKQSWNDRFKEGILEHPKYYRAGTEGGEDITKDVKVIDKTDVAINGTTYREEYTYDTEARILQKSVSII